MTITHSFVSEIEDFDDTSIVRPSDWNADHEVDLTLSMMFTARMEELLGLVLTELQKVNIHLSSISGEAIKDEDI